MSNSSAVAATRTDYDRAPTEVSDSGNYNDDGIMEVEEVADSSNSPNNAGNDLSKEMESEGHNSYLGLGSSTQERFKARRPYNVLAVGETKGFRNSSCSNKPFTRQKEESHENHEHSEYPKSMKQLTFLKGNGSQESEISKKNLRTFLKVKTTERENDLHSDLEAYFSNSEIVGAETTSPSSVARKNVGIAFPMEGCLGERTSEEETKQMDMHSGDDKLRMASRLASPAIRTRSLSPGTEIKVGNKRPAIVCDFFSKGWCIKGNSCRFLHVKDDTNNTSLQPEQDVAAASVKAEFQIEERILPEELEESKRLSQFQENHRFSFLQRECISLGNPSSSQQLASSKDDGGVISSLKDVRGESLRKNWSADDYGNHASLLNGSSSPIFRNSLLHEYRSSPSQFIHNNYLSLSHSLNSSLRTSAPPGGSLPPHHISAWTGSAVPFKSSSLNASPLGSQKLLDSDRQCRTSTLSSLLRSSSPFSGSEPEKPLLSAVYKTKESSNDWEPSVPFRPSFHIDLTSIISPGCQYDPLRDSFDSPKLGDVSVKVSCSSVRGSSINTPHQQVCGDSMLSRTIVSESNGEKSSVSSHDRFQENVVDKDCQTPGKDSHIAREEAVGKSSTDVQNQSMVKEDDPPVSTKSEKIYTNHDSRHQNDGSRRNKDLKIDRVKQNNEMDIEHKTDGDWHKESKVMRHFRASLVDFVKELLKPTWREGKLSKDAHNRIVKKAVDKVLSASQPNQIPTTVESIKQYLSSSQPKIAKLIEGYVDKYGKS